MLKKKTNKIIILCTLFIFSATSFSQIGQGKLNLGIKSGFQYLNFDNVDENFNLSYGILSQLKLNRYLRLNFDVNYLKFRINDMEESILPLSLGFMFDLKQDEKKRLYSSFNAGILSYNDNVDITQHFKFSFGYEYFLGNKVGLFTDIGYSYTLSDEIDSFKSGKNDGFLLISAGMNFYINSRNYKYFDDRSSEYDYLIDSTMIKSIENVKIDKIQELTNLLDDVKKDEDIKIIHKEVFEVEEGKNHYIFCMTKGDFLFTAFVFRKDFKDSWHVLKMKKIKEDDWDTYGVLLKGGLIESPKFEYFLMAVEKDLMNAGYFGDKDDPIIVNVAKNKKFWFKIGKYFSIINMLAILYFAL